MLLLDSKTIKQMFAENKIKNKKILKNKNSKYDQLSRTQNDFLPFGEKIVKFAEELVIGTCKMPRLGYSYPKL